MKTRKHIEVLLNAGAGLHAGGDTEADLRRRFSELGCIANLETFRQGADLEAGARRAVAARPDVVVAGGGDGTLSAVAGVLAGTGIPMGILPLGTLNHFAKDAGIPFDPGAAVDTVCRGRVIQVDVGRVNGHVFINNSSLGLYPSAVRKRDELRQGLAHGKWPAFIWAAAWVLRRFPFYDVEICVDGKSLRRRTPLIFIGNNDYEIDGLDIGSRKRLDAGHLSVHVIHSRNRLGLVALAGRAVAGRLRQSRDFETLHATRIELSTRRRDANVATDGEVARRAMPLVYEIDTRALALVVPVEGSGPT